jgi:hypothetical protein
MNMFAYFTAHIIIIIMYLIIYNIHITVDNTTQHAICSQNLTCSESCSDQYPQVDIHSGATVYILPIAVHQSPANQTLTPSHTSFCQVACL